jgi:hypothetical protein
MGWAVVWNSTATSFLIQYPPGAPNFAIGSTGKYDTDSRPGGGPVLRSGIYDSQNTPVAPRSLYLAQLCLRLGPQALRNIGY